MRKCCPKGAADDNAQKTILKHILSCLPVSIGIAFAFCYAQSGLWGLMGPQSTLETRSKMITNFAFILFYSLKMYCR